MTEPTDTFRFYVEFSWAGTWTIEPLQSLALGRLATSEELADALRTLADRVEKRRHMVRAIYSEVR